MKKLHNFICTHTKPRIFWKPKAMNSAADSRLKDSKKTVDSEFVFYLYICLQKDTVYVFLIF